MTTNITECRSGRKYGPRKTSLADRLWPKVDKRGIHECWEWQAGCRRGYGRVRMNTLILSTHRLAWELTYGPIPDGMFVLHRCDNRKCCNPAHLFLGTNGDNVRDRNSKSRHAHGNNHGHTIIPDSEISFIRASMESQRTIARRFGVNHTTIGRIKRGRRQVLS